MVEFSRDSWHDRWPKTKFVRLVSLPKYGNVVLSSTAFNYHGIILTSGLTLVGSLAMRKWFLKMSPIDIAMQG